MYVLGQSKIPDLAAAKDKIMQRNIPGSKESIPVIGIGTWQSFDVAAKHDYTNLSAIMQEFIHMGGKMIDSSPMYGKAEKVTGEITHSFADKIFFATKVWTTGKESGIRQIENSFRLLQTDVIDLLQIHNLQDWKTHISTLRNLKEQGKIRYTGITHYVPSAFAEMEKILKSEKFDFMQIPYSIVRREAEARILSLARDLNVGVIINRPFEGGDIFRNLKNLAVPDFASEFGSWAQIFLKYLVSHPAVTCVIPATSKIKHLQENMQAGTGKLMDEKTRTRIADYIKKGGI